MSIEKRLAVVLAFTALCIYSFLLQQRTQDAWRLFFFYWLIVTMKNAADAAGRD